MAKADNIFNIRGRLGDFIFCQRNGKTYVKRYSGGFTKATHPEPPEYKSWSRAIYASIPICQKSKARAATVFVAAERRYLP